MRKKKTRNHTGKDRTLSSQVSQSIRLNERTSSVVVCEPTPVTMESSLREVGRMWHLRSGNFAVLRSFLLCSTRSFIDGVIVNMKERNLTTKLHLTIQYNTMLFWMKHCVNNFSKKVKDTS